MPPRRCNAKRGGLLAGSLVGFPPSLPRRFGTAQAAPMDRLGGRRLGVGREEIEETLRRANPLPAKPRPLETPLPGNS